MHLQSFSSRNGLDYHMRKSNAHADENFAYCVRADGVVEVDFLWSPLPVYLPINPPMLNHSLSLARHTRLRSHTHAGCHSCASCCS